MKPTILNEYKISYIGTSHYYSHLTWYVRAENERDAVLLVYEQIEPENCILAANWDILDSLGDVVCAANSSTVLMEDGELYAERIDESFYPTNE